MKHQLPSPEHGDAASEDLENKETMISPMEAVRFCSGCSREHWPLLAVLMAHPVGRGFLMAAISQTVDFPNEERESVVVRVALFARAACSIELDAPSPSK